MVKTDGRLPLLRLCLSRALEPARDMSYPMQVSRASRDWMWVWVYLIMAGMIPHELRAAELVYAKDGSGIPGYKDTPVLPWCGFHVHDPDRPMPPRVDPGPALAFGKPPSDAMVLFDGSHLRAWQPSDWKLGDGWVEAVTGELMSKQEFGDMQLHLEWRTPNPPEGELFNRGNNGV